MILDEIVAKKRVRILEAKKRRSQEELTELAIGSTKGHSHLFLEAIRKKDRLRVIAEVKKASPSKGLLSKDFPYLEIAKSYERNGAAGISVLTEEDFFEGKDQYLEEIRQNVAIPILRKDFTVDEYQIYEAKLLRADCILLICRILDDERLEKFYHLSSQIGIDCLFEVHNQEEIKRALRVGARIIGVNNRDLDTFKVDLSHSERLISAIPSDVIRISESGIRSKEDMLRLEAYGFDAVLIGETLMKANDEEEIRRLTFYG